MIALACSGSIFFEKNHVFGFQCNLYYIENLQISIFCDIIRLQSKLNAKFSLVKRGTTDENAQHDDIGQYGKLHYRLPKEKRQIAEFQRGNESIEYEFA